MRINIKYPVLVTHDGPMVCYSLAVNIISVIVIMEVSRADCKLIFVMFTGIVWLSNIMTSVYSKIFSFVA